MRIPAPRGVSWQEYAAFGIAVDVGTDLSAVFARHLHELIVRITPAIERQAVSAVIEDYVVFRITSLCDEEGRALSGDVLTDDHVTGLLLDEDRPLSAGGQERAAAEPLLVLRHRPRHPDVEQRARGGRRPRGGGHPVRARVRQRATARAADVRRAARQRGAAAERPGDGGARAALAPPARLRHGAGRVADARRRFNRTRRAGRELVQGDRRRLPRAGVHAPRSRSSAAAPGGRASTASCRCCGRPTRCCMPRPRRGAPRSSRWRS